MPDKVSPPSADSGWKSRIRDELQQYLTQARVDKVEAYSAIVSPFDEILLHGQYACANDQVDKALRSFKECARIRPDAFLPQCALGRIFMTQGVFLKAEKHIRRAAELNPRDFKNIVTWLFLLLKTGKDQSRTWILQEQISERVNLTARQLGLSPVAPETLRLDIPESFWGQCWRPNAREEYRGQKYAVLHDVLPQGYRELILAQQRSALRGGNMSAQPELRRHATNDLPISVVANYQLAELVSRITGSTVIPTYTCAIHYLPGGHIPAHKDRVQNELSMSLSLAITPDNTSSALYAGADENNMHSIDLAPNSGLFYRGAEVTHARAPLPDGCHVDQTIFGFRTVGKKHCYCI